MYSTQNMGLTSWNLINDNFNHTQMDANWQSIDQHDHSFGRGVQINTGGIANNAITTGLIAAQAVTNAQLALNAVATTNIQNQAVTNTQIAPGSIYGNLIPNGAITQPMLDPTIIPLGTVITWWRPSGTSTTPGGGWEIMDGRPWSGITNSLGLNTGNIPDMRGHFAQGADINGTVAPGIGVSGGSNTASLAHVHNVNPHNHNVPSHAHTINFDGSHMHLWQGGLHMGARSNAFQGGGTGFDADAYNFPYNNITVQTKDGDWVTNSWYSLYIRNLTSNPNWGTYNPPTGPYPAGAGSEYVTGGQTDGVADMDTAGLHSHGGKTEGSSTLQTDGGNLHTTDSQLGTVNTVPQNVTLLFIMRVR